MRKWMQLVSYTQGTEPRHSSQIFFFIRLLSCLLFLQSLGAYRIYSLFSGLRVIVCKKSQYPAVLALTFLVRMEFPCVGSNLHRPVSDILLRLRSQHLALV